MASEGDRGASGGWLTIPTTEFENLHEQIRLKGELVNQLTEQLAEAQRLVADMNQTIMALRGALREICHGARSLDYAVHVARVALGQDDG